MRRVVIYGGTFNPPHNGHVSAAEAAYRELKPDRIIWMPAGNPPHKRLPEDTPEKRHIMEMSRLAAAGFDYIEVSGLELYGGCRYTVDTVRETRKYHPEAELWILVGADMFFSLPTWHKAGDLMNAVRIAAVCRAGGQMEEMRMAARRYELDWGAAVRLIENAAVEVSSTELRRSLRKREPCAEIPEPVYEYILANGLYTNTYLPESGEDHAQVEKLAKEEKK